MKRQTILGSLAAIGLIVALASGVYWQRILTVNLPPRVDSATRVESSTLAQKELEAAGGKLVAVLGTGSMAPYIPPAPFGLDPRKAVVAYVVTRPGAVFSDIRPGFLVIYEYAPEPGSHYLHVAAQKTVTGWIMSGLHNARSESWTRVTEQNFQAIAAKVFVWKS